MYTGHCETENGNIQTQNIVISEDGYIFKKYEGNPVISKDDLPPNCTICDFRDPSIFEHDGMYYVLIGNKSNEGVAQMLLYKSNDLLKWEFDRILISSNELGYMLECPSSAKIGDKRVLITSPQGLKDRGEDF
jgi:beta-fructofuranosidase